MTTANALSRRSALIGAVAMLAWPRLHAKLAAPAEVRAELPGAQLQGSGRLRVLGFSVYDSRLWVTPKFQPQDFAAHLLALELQYTRALVGAKIAERSIEEMRRQGPIAPDSEGQWLAQMTTLFPDVNAGDRLTGVQQPGEATRFFFNGSLRGEVKDAEFTRRFFGIWLSPQTSQPALRDALLGIGRAAS